MVDRDAYPKGARFRVTEPHWMAGSEVEVYGHTSANIRAITDDGRGLLLAAKYLQVI